MSLPPRLGELVEVRGALTADRRGQVHATVKELTDAADEAAAVAVAVTELGTAGAALGFGALHRLEMKGPRRTTLTAVRPDLFLLVDVDPVKRLARAIETLDAWQRGELLPATGGRLGPVRPHRRAAGRGATVHCPRHRPSTAGSAKLMAIDDPWGSLRRALVRSHLTRAAAFQQAIVDAGSDLAPGAGQRAALPRGPAGGHAAAARGNRRRHGR